MKFVTYNIHYAVGKDLQHDIGRIEATWVDGDAHGSDHQPEWLSLNSSGAS